MVLSNQKFREIVLQLLYSQEVGHPNETHLIELMMNELAVSKKNVRLAYEKTQKILTNLPKIDALISSVSATYDLNRIQIVTKNILQLALFEMFFDHQVPPKVAIAEAIRLSRKFNTPESASFVNAILDQLYQTSLGTPGDVDQLSQRLNDLEESEKQASERALEQLYEQDTEEELHGDKG